MVEPSVDNLDSGSSAFKSDISPSGSSFVSANESVQSTSKRLSLSACVGIVLVLGLSVVFWNLRQWPLANWDEAWYAKIALDMAREGRWLSYDMDGDMGGVALKPPLCYWAMVVAFKCLGPTVLAVRLFSATCYVLLVVSVTVFCHRNLSSAVALLAAFFLLADRQLLFNHCARSGDMDAPLMLSLTLVMFGIWRIRTRTEVLWGLPAWACAPLIKGLAALQIVPAALAWFCLTRRWRLVPWWLFVVMVGLVPLTVFMVLRESRQPGVVQRFLFDDSWQRLTSEFDAPSGTSLLYLRRGLRASWPALIGLALAVLLAGKRLRLSSQLAEPADSWDMLTFLLLWCLVPVAMFSAAQTKHTWYIYPSFAPGYILVAWLTVAGLSALEPRRRKLSALAISVLLAAGMGVPTLWKTFRVSSHARQRTHELDRLITTIRSTSGKEPLIVYRPEPRIRFLLTRERIRYSPANSEADIITLVQQKLPQTLLLYDWLQRPRIQSILSGRARTPLAELPVLELDLERVE